MNHSPLRIYLQTRAFADNSVFVEVALVLFKQSTGERAAQSTVNSEQSTSPNGATGIDMTNAPTIAHLFPKRQCRKSSLTQSKEILSGTSSQ